VYKLDTNGVAIDSLSTGLGESQGLAYDGANFYYVRRYTSYCTVIKTTSSGTIVDSMRFSSPARYLGGAVWDGSFVWVSQYYPNPGRLLKLNWTTKTIVDSIMTIGDQPEGVAWDGQYLYYAMDVFSTEPNLNLIYVVNPTTHDTVRTIRMPEPPTTDSNPTGLTWDGAFLWLIARPVGGGSTKVLYKYNLGGAGSPAINVPVKFFDFGTVQIGSSGQVTATIQNIGTASLRIDSARILYSARFTTNLTTPLTITAGNSANFNITFAPVTYGADSAHVVLYHNDITRPSQTIRALGFGNYPPPVINVPSSYNFGTRRVGSSNTWILTIQNQGAQALVVDSARFTSSAFSIESGVLPVSILPLASRNVRVWFFPSAAVAYTDTMKIYSNAGNLPVAPIALSGQGTSVLLPIGTVMWSATVPLHPVSNTTRRVRAVRSIGDVTGDGKQDVIVCTDNYWTMAFNGNASGSNDSLWAFNTYISSYSAGPVASEGDYSYQKGLAIASDLNGDGYNDVVIGTGGGNEHVYAINGRTGRMLWTFGTDHPDSFGLGDISGVDVSTDFNNDGIPDVIAAGSATGTGGVGGRRSIYLFNGANGNLIWQAPLPGFTHAVTAIGDITGDGRPDVIGTVGEPSYKMSAYNGVNGALLWDYPLTSGTGGAKEVLAYPVPGQPPDVILGAFWGPVYRINGTTGTMVWQRPTGSKDPTRMARLRDINNDGLDEIVVSLLVGDAQCLDGATGNVLWTYPANSGMDIRVIRDLNNDGYEEVAVASQNADVLILRGNNGQLLYQHNFAGGSEQARSVAQVIDLDGNNSYEIFAGSDLSNIVMLSGGLDAGPVSVWGIADLPTRYALSTNYPNPFNPSTSFRFDAPEPSNVDIMIYDLLGRQISSMTYERLAPGSHLLNWDGKDNAGQQLASGIYFLHLTAKSAEGDVNTFTSSLKLMLMK
jgi:outer membrane protein assembly factor BamB